MATPELMKMMQSSNGAFKSELMKNFVASQRGDFPQVSPAPGQGPNFPTTTTTTTTRDTTDNANILNQRTDNQTSTTTTTTDNNPLIMEKNDNANANVNRNTSQSAVPDRPDSNANVSEVQAVLREARASLSETQTLLVQQVQEATVDAHLATCHNTLQAVQDATARFTQLQLSGQLPDMSKLSLSSSSMWEKMTEQMMPEMAKTVQFCKMLPGFSELCLTDQMQLIKQGTFEVMMTRFAMLIDHEKETMLDPSHKMVCPRKVVQQMPMGQFLDGFFQVGAKFNPLGLLDGEIGLFTAVLVFCPSRSSLADVKLISSLQALYQKALYTLIKHNHSDPDSKFSQLLSLVPMFRRIGQEHDKALKSMKQQAPEQHTKQFPPIHREFFSQ